MRTLKLGPNAPFPMVSRALRRTCSRDQVGYRLSKSATQSTSNFNLHDASSATSAAPPTTMPGRSCSLSEREEVGLPLRDIAEESSDDEGVSDGVGEVDSLRRLGTSLALEDREGGEEVAVG